MYTVSSKSSKLVATRRGISQQTFRDLGKRTADDGLDINLPKPVFHHKAGHHHQNHSIKSQSMTHTECPSPQHEEIVKFVHDSWCSVVVEQPYETPSSPDSAISLNTSSNRLAPNGQSPHSRNVSKSSSTSSSSSLSSSSYSVPAQIYFAEKPDDRLQDFKPFDLEAWWGRRLYHSITKSL